MKKRITAGVLWLYAGWFVGAFSAFAFGLPTVLGPIVGLAAAGLVAVDPRRLIWDRTRIATSPRKAIPA